jgi:DNA-directed RNA polymerase subunit L
MALIENKKVSNNGLTLSCELKGFPVSFVNGLRRIVLSNIPTVVVRDVSILENTTQLPHEMLKHRMEMLPIYIQPNDSSLVKDTKIELNIKADKDRIVTTDDFKVDSRREGILMKDRDFDTPLLFLHMRAGESLHITASLSIETDNVSQVCVSTTSWHIDPELVKGARKEFEESGQDVRIFDNTLQQRYYSRDDRGRPNWFDFLIESIGVLKSEDILKMAVKILQRKLDEYIRDALENIQKEKDPGTFHVSLEQGGHTIGYLMQEVMYNDANVKFVSYDIPHPLKNTMILRWNSEKSPESILKNAYETIKEYCSVVEKVL